jgi:glycosyltransferase involved in cell wall biosynthesis
MATYNGAEFLQEQLISIQSQSHANWSLWISDDGSTDETLEIIENFKKSLPNKNIQLLSGPRRGLAANFLSLLANPRITANYYAFCDQDDVWFPYKLEKAISADSNAADVPFLYGARTTVTNHALGNERDSSQIMRPTGFKNALVENFAGGNTMIFNHATCNLARQTDMLFEIVAHDWLMYQLVSGVGGKVFYDTDPCLYYRQHNGNQIGDNTGVWAKLSRIHRLLNGRYRHWNSQNLIALESYKNYFLHNNREVMLKFTRARSNFVLSAVRNLRASGVYRQNKIGTIALFLAAIIKKI